MSSSIQSSGIPQDLSCTYGGKGHLLACAVWHLVTVIATKTQWLSGYFPADQSLPSRRSVWVWFVRHRHHPCVRAPGPSLKRLDLGFAAGLEVGRIEREYYVVLVLLLLMTITKNQVPSFFRLTLAPSVSSKLLSSRFPLYIPCFSPSHWWVGYPKMGGVCHADPANVARRLLYTNRCARYVGISQRLKQTYLDAWSRVGPLTNQVPPS